MEPLTAMQALSTAFTIYEKASKVYRDWIGKEPDTTTKEAMTKELTQAEESMELAKAQMAETLGYQLCRAHFPPGIMLEVSKDSLVCRTCRFILGEEKLYPPSLPAPRARGTYF